MIKLINVDKYFNKGKQNSIHVINNTSLEFPEKGLVTLLGSSGSGKTTLLNVISGLDKANGTIIFDKETIKGYNSNKWDKIRAHKIGFIFQNYYLLENKTVYENIKLVLNMIGIIDESEVDYRINYVLNAVGMFRYRKKLASDLSGGQKQRVAIARAIVKNPEVIIADEPTGNLDTNNSLEIMKIIKEISKEKLVVLVTHETNLAYRYSDHIVTLSDGRIASNEKNSLQDSTNIEYDDHNIYLQDLNKVTLDNFEVYSDESVDKLEFTLVKIGKTYYLQTNETVKVEIVNEKSSKKIVNLKKTDVSENEKLEDTNFSLSDLEKIKSKRVKKRTLSLKDSFIEAFRRLANLGRKAKFQLIALILLGLFFSVSIHILFSSLFVDAKQIIEDENLYKVETRASVNIQEYLNKSNVITYFGGSNVNSDGEYFSWEYNLSSLDIANPLLPVESVAETDLILGRLPVNNFEVLIDESILDSLNSKAYMYHSIGINKPSDLIGQKLTKNLDTSKLEYTIVGTVRTNTRAIYATKTMLLNRDNYFYTYFSFFSVNINDLQLIAGKMPEVRTDGKYEALINENFSNQYKIGDTLDKDISGEMQKEFIVSGYYKNEAAVIDAIYLNDSVYQQILFEEANNTSRFFREIFVYSLNGDDLSKEGIVNVRQQTFDRLEDERVANIQSSLTQIIVSLIISALIFYFLVRSSMTRRVKELSIMRSLGVNKYEVRSLYTLEYIIMTTFTSMIGVIAGALVANAINYSFLNEVFKIRVTPLSIIVSVLGIYVVNVFVSLLPVNNLLRKTPSQMLTLYDI